MHRDTHLNQTGRVKDQDMGQDMEWKFGSPYDVMYCQRNCDTDQWRGKTYQCAHGETLVESDHGLISKPTSFVSCVDKEQ